MRARISLTPRCCAIASARACPRSSSRSRQERPQAERSTPRNRRRAGPDGTVNATVMIAANRKSKKLAILDEAGAFRQLVIECAGAAVGFVGQPIDAAGAGGARPLLNRRDQRAADLGKRCLAYDPRFRKTGSPRLLAYMGRYRSVLYVVPTSNLRGPSLGSGMGTRS